MDFLSFRLYYRKFVIKEKKDPMSVLPKSLSVSKLKVRP